MKIAGSFDDDKLPQWITNFIKLYQKLGSDSLELLNEVYSSDVIFIDPIHHLTGIDNVVNYFTELYSNLSYCTFNVEEVIENQHQAAIYWTMQFVHPKLNKGHKVQLHGHSQLKVKNGKVIYHRDYFDLGAMIYEQVPLLGMVIKQIKKRLSAFAS